MLKLPKKIAWVAAAATLLAAPLHAQSYPERVVRMVVPFAAGGGTDVLARSFAGELSEKLGQNVVVENVTGAAGFIGTQQVVNSDADGYTLLFAPTSPYTLAKSAQPPATYDPAEGLVPVARIAEQPTVFAVRTDAGIEDFEDFIAKLKAEPGAYSFSSSGVGGEMHLTGASLQESTQTEMLHVGFRGGGPAILALVSGEVDMMPVVTGSIMPYIQDGKVKALATTAAERLDQLPEVPTTRELGHPDVAHVPSWGLFAPAGLPDDILAQLEQGVQEITDSTEYQEYLASLSITPGFMTGEEFLSFLQRQEETLGDLSARLFGRN